MSQLNPLTVQYSLAFFKTHRAFMLGITLLVLQSVTLPGWAASFMGLGDLEGGLYLSQPFGVSSDGKVVVGASESSSGLQAFRWTIDQGMQGLGDLPGGAFTSVAYAVSADGSVIVGRGISSFGVEAFRWTVGQGMEGLGDLQGGTFRSSANGISADGKVIVGSGTTNLNPKAIRWTADSGMVDLENYVMDNNGSATATSGDGKVIVGNHNVYGGRQVAFRWVQGVGMRDFIDDGINVSQAWDVTEDGGSVIGNFGGRAFRWSVQGGMQFLNVPENTNVAIPYGISADGSTIVGMIANEQAQRAVIWDETNNWRSIRDILVNDFGIDMTGWQLIRAVAVSADGSVIVGLGFGPSTSYGPEAWIADISGQVNSAPQANAGIDQTVFSGDLVMLDGSNSADPDAHYPLSYQWNINQKPAGSTAVLSNTSIVNPTFTADMFGDYVIELMVTDSLGLSSLPDTVTISTINSAPVANAGPDQLVVIRGSAVELDGSNSFDTDGDPITYLWSFLGMPAGSSAALNDATVVNPVFIADIQGDYIIQLVVTDSFGAASSADTVMVSFNNLQPVADAGIDQFAVAGDTVMFDGSGSTDGNLDPLTYVWSIVSAPVGNTAVLTTPNSSQSELAIDVAGVYVISLMVNDGFIDSTPDNLTVTAVTPEAAATGTLKELNNLINLLDLSVFNNPNQQNALTNKINAVIDMIAQGNYQQALDKLQNDILGKTNGCAQSGVPDPNDWIDDCAIQNQIYPFVIETIDLLNRLL